MNRQRLGNLPLTYNWSKPSAKMASKYRMRLTSLLKHYYQQAA